MMGELTTRQAIFAVARQLDRERVVSTTGYICRDTQAAGDRPENFYMIGSMGIASSTAMGIALAQPDQTVVVFDGDGAALMGLGALPAIASVAPANLIHLVFDNEVYASTGRQPTYSSSVDLAALARAAGYRVVRTVNTEDALISAWKEIRKERGPVFLLVKCVPDEGTPMERVGLEPEAITARFMEAIHGTNERF